MSNTELKALISLLDDPDDTIYDEVKHKLISFGGEIIPLLENAWEVSFDNLLQERIEDIIHFMQFESVKTELSEWKASEDHNIIDAAILIAKYQYPDIDTEGIKATINEIKQDVWLELNENLTAFEQVNILNKMIFEVHGFYGNTKNINSPQNSYINNVVETKKGNPITLGIIYIAICQELNIPIYGVDVPAHFILAYAEDSKNVLFYLNIFNKGTIFGPDDIDKFLEQLKKMPKAEYYTPCSSLAIIRRLVQHLIYTYDNLGYVDKREELEELLAILG